MDGAGDVSTHSLKSSASGDCNKDVKCEVGDVLTKKIGDSKRSASNKAIDKENLESENFFDGNVLTCEGIETDEEESEPELIEVPRSNEAEKDITKSQNRNQKTFVMEEDDNHLTEEDGWLDIFGSGDFKKRVLKSGDGRRVQAKNVVTVNYTTYKTGSDLIIEKVENFEFIVGDLDVVKGIDLAIPIMEHGELAEILVPSRLAFGKFGRPPDIPPDCDLRYQVEILKVEELDDENLRPLLAMKYGNQKRDRGNFWYGQNDHISAIHCYKRAAEFLDGIQDGSDCSPQLLQDILDTKIKVYNNMAAAHMKMESHDQALKAVDFVLKIQPKNVKGLFRKAKILSAKGLTDEAIVFLKKAAELEPETKVIQQELQRLQKKRQIEQKNQKEMYKRMFPQQSPSKSKSSRLKEMIRHWTFKTGSCVAVFAVGVAAYRMYFG